ncbi:hypothetical protein EST38_g60 [Candolleomyces aberdarensis]|uniref:Sodium/calcium exchanger membrane region domain-containing protein n=1 Tax=Candolleomyces aberdarensis TaxID=2316362 RepID=A0A4V1Q5J9_9AGAR|nr:hypothetical protein EST38_g60 [Candolleomyces aberdarensis]
MDQRSPGLNRRLSRLSRNSVFLGAEDTVTEFWDRFSRKGRKNVGIWDSLHAIAVSSWLNIFLVFVPIAWVSHFLHWPKRVTFALSFMAIIPLEGLTEWGGDQMALYLGKDFGDLLIVTCHNAVEATLAIILLLHCEISLLKATIIGVVILHLLLVPGAAFITGGARVLHQDLHPHLTDLNHSLLALGVLSLMLPAAFFAALRGNFDPHGTAEANSEIINDLLRGNILKMSRGVAILLLIMQVISASPSLYYSADQNYSSYICSRIYLHNPPGEENHTLHLLATTPEGMKERERQLSLVEPSANQYVVLAMLVIVISIMAATAEWLVKSLQFARETRDIEVEYVFFVNISRRLYTEFTSSERWFGLILLPLVSYAADGTVAIVYFIRRLLKHYFKEPAPVSTLAKARAIDLSIQFLLFWMPFFVLLGWWTGRPMTLLFDLFEVAIVIGACFIVNYVTADAKTNWAEGATMVSFYVMIAVCAWYYPGQTETFIMSQCRSVAVSLASLASGEPLEAEHH